MLLKFLSNEHFILANVGRKMASFGTSQCSFNRLSKEKSPYLLQHAANPVDWYPWGPEAFRKAKCENKMIFLSVGYSTCHWCHVMEHESFKNEVIGKFLNDNFVSIKVDREERPDVDRMYMTFIQATQGGGGWPMSVWLTPDLEPVVGGTYFPPDDRYYGRPGFSSILHKIASAWDSDPDAVKRQGQALLTAIKEAALSKPGAAGGLTPDVLNHDQIIETCFEQLSKSYDSEKGGFSRAPKFPQPVNLNFLMRYRANCADSTKAQLAMQMVSHTLGMMANGGIYDHINKGFHRYSTDRDWHVPHFEKMLYDQGQLAVTYATAYQITKAERFGKMASNILEYVNSELSHPMGGFFSAQDADSLPTPDALGKKEGAFCVWTWSELKAALGAEVVANSSSHLTWFDVFVHHYSCKVDGNVDPFNDPHDELKDQNVLLVKHDVANTAANFSLDNAVVSEVLDKCRLKLYSIRARRPKPHLDDKIITAWNGLMISGFARTGQALGNEQIILKAEQSLVFIHKHLYDADKRLLMRIIYSGKENDLVTSETPIYGFVDDYAYLIRAALDVYESRCKHEWILEWALQMQTRQDELFWDEASGGYFTSPEGDSSIVMRHKEDQDGAEPNPNSVSVDNLLRLCALLDRPDFSAKATRVITSYASQLASLPMALPEMVTAALPLNSPSTQIIIVGDPDAPDTMEMVKAVHEKFITNRTVLVVTQGGWLASTVPKLVPMRKIEEKATAYVCKKYTCHIPTNVLGIFRQQLKSAI